MVRSFGFRRAVPTAVPLVLAAGAIGLLAVVQFQWLTELGNASRLRMERDLRVAVQAASADVSLGVNQLTALLEGASDDSAAVAEAWRQWRRGAPAIAGLYRSAKAAFAPDSAFLADSLLPALAHRITTAAELSVALALVRRDPSGSERVVTRTGRAGEGPPEAVSAISLERKIRMVFHPRSSAVAADSGGVDLGDSSPVWSLQAWHESGSLEQAVTRIRRRNLAVGFGLIAVLVVSAGLTLMAFRRNERLAADRATILAGISHEVRTPIAVIRSAADNLSSGIVTAPGEVREYGRLLEREAGRLEDNLEGALSFARAAAPGQGGTDLVDLREVALEIQRTSEAPARVEVVPGEAVTCRGDRRAMTVAIRNIVANALAYSADPAAVTVTLRHAGSSAEVTVLDRGPGIPPAERGRIFEPFYRGAAGAAAGRTGLGLGLALADRVATMHRGSLLYEDRAGGGSVFQLRLPAA